jgi:serine/threonine protein kinase
MLSCSSLLADCLCNRYDHEQRLTAREALDHPYFNSVRQSKLDEGGSTDSLPSEGAMSLSSGAV